MHFCFIKQHDIIYIIGMILRSLKLFYTVPGTVPVVVGSVEFKKKKKKVAIVQYRYRSLY